MPKYRYVGTRASEVRVGDNVVPLGMGDFVTVSDSDLKHEDNQHVKEFLMPVTEAAKKSAEGGEK